MDDNNSNLKAATFRAHELTLEMKTKENLAIKIKIHKS